MKGLSGKVVVVTGAGQGIGESYARRLAAEGCRVVVAEINAEQAERVAKQIVAEGGDALAVVTDVTDEESVTAMVGQTVEVYGRLDGLVNNAAVYYGIGLNPVDEIGIDMWDRVMAVNAKGTFLASRAVRPAMQAGGGGRIVNVASTVAFMGPAFVAHYVASKGAVIALTRSLASEFAADGIIVNAVVPGATWDEASEVLAGDPGVKDLMVEQQAIKRPQLPEDLTGIVCFLLSEEAPMMTGQLMVSDGGLVFH